MALQRPPSKLSGWYGAPRRFSYMAEVQRVFNKHCLKCHDYGKKGAAKLNLASDRLNTFNTSYVELWLKKYINAIGAGPAQTQQPYSWGSHASKLVCKIRKGHNDVKLDKESFDRIVTWIDLNAPYYPVYASAYPDNLAGRSPLGNEQISRLSQFTGVHFAGSARYKRKLGPQISFDRPELSSFLAKFTDKNDPNYIEVLAIIKAGSEMLAQRPRADMPGFVACPTDQQRQKKY